MNEQLDTLSDPYSSFFPSLSPLVGRKTVTRGPTTHGPLHPFWASFPAFCSFEKQNTGKEGRGLMTRFKTYCLVLFPTNKTDLLCHAYSHSSSFFSLRIRLSFPLLPSVSQPVQFVSHTSSHCVSAQPKSSPPPTLEVCIHQSSYHSTTTHHTTLVILLLLLLLLLLVLLTF